MVRALLCQAAVFHAPTDLIIMVCTRRPDHPYWSWVKWLPHAQHPSEVDYAGPIRLIDPSLQACIQIAVEQRVHEIPHLVFRLATEPRRHVCRGVNLD